MAPHIQATLMGIHLGLFMVGGMAATYILSLFWLAQAR